MVEGAKSIFLLSLMRKGSAVELVINFHFP